MSERELAILGEPAETVSSIADRWACTTRTVKRRIEQGDLNGAVVAGRWLVFRASREAYERRQVARTRQIQKRASGCAGTSDA